MKLIGLLYRQIRCGKNDQYLFVFFCKIGGKKMRLTKYIFLLLSFVISLFIGFIVHIRYIAADEYSHFDKSMEAAKKALFLENINGFYLPAVLVLHLIIFLTFKYRDAKGYK